MKQILSMADLILKCEKKKIDIILWFLETKFAWKIKRQKSFIKFYLKCQHCIYSQHVCALII